MERQLWESKGKKGQIKLAQKKSNKTQKTRTFSEKQKTAAGRTYKWRLSFESILFKRL